MDFLAGARLPSVCTFTLAACVLLLGTGACGSSATPVAEQRPVLTPATVAAAPRFSDEVERFVAADRASMPPAGGVLFVGSSSIRMWPHLATDFPGARTIQRGVGGTRLDEILAFAPRIVLPYKPRLIVLYAGDNDIAEGRSPAEVLASFREFVELVHRSLPGTRIAFVSIKPSESRWSLVEEMTSANALVRQFAESDSMVAYVDVFGAMLGADGHARPELFLADKLHMTEEGYAIWRRILAPVVANF
ncbi:MAG: SGNH/GDSL hydrolase family protein [Gemmatimonadaceae bacterium]